MSDSSTNLSANTASQWVSATDFANALVKARREALEEAARVAETLGVDPQTNTNTDAYRHKQSIARAIRALKEPARD
jgi:hypothetical protein